MSVTTVSSKGQVVLPKPVRDALRIRPGTRLGVEVEGTRVILETVLPIASPQAWQPVNPAGVKLSTSKLCKPVDLSRKNAPRSG
jgi:AbrB family looped-hinge helix DNA binding protein